MGLIPTLGVSSFSNLGFAMLFLFISDEAFVRLRKSIGRLGTFFGKSIQDSITFQIGIATSTFAIIWLRFEIFHANIVFLMIVWLMLSTPVVVLPAVAILRRSGALRKTGLEKQDSFLDYFLPRPRYLALLLVPLAVNGLAPYAGLKTQTGFTMLSNLRVLGSQPNHLIMPASFRISHPKLIEIIASNNESFAIYAERPLLITELEFQRKASEIKKDFLVTCIYLGEEITLGRIDGNLTDHPLLAPQAWLKMKFLRFKDVSKMKHCERSW